MSDFLVKGEEGKMVIQMILSARTAARSIENCCQQLMPIVREQKLVTQDQPIKDSIAVIEKAAAEISTRLNAIYQRNAAELLTEQTNAR